MEGFFRRATAFVLLLLSLCLATAAFGQGIVTGSISGTVQDPQGAIVPNATVRGVQVGTNTTVTAQTDATGYFQLKSLPVGTYMVTIEASGFSKLQLSNVGVEAGKNNSVGSQPLRVGATNETVNVEASAPIVETSSSQIGATFEARTVSQLPLPGGFDILALFVPGVANNGSANFSNTNGASIANNGLRGRSNNFQLDGQANNDNSVAGPMVFLSNPDVVGEVMIVSNNFGAEYGRNSGSVINYVTKAGTNQFHGSAYEYEQGDWSFSKTNGQKNPLLGFCPAGVAAGTATAFASSCKTPVIPRYVENRWGGTFGGPVVKNHLWFFGSYQNDRQRSKSTSTSSSLTPTPAGIAALATAFPNNNAVTALKNFGPYGITAGNPQPAGTVANQNVTVGNTTVAVPFAFVTRTVGTPNDDTQATARGDWQISSKDRFFYRYIYQSSVNAVGSGVISSGAYVAVPARDGQHGFDYTHTWSPNIVQQVRVSHGSGAFTFAGGTAFPNCSIAGVLTCQPNIGYSDSVSSFTGFGLATNLPQDRQVHNTQYSSNVTWSKGRHTIKFGGELDHQHSPNHFLPSINGGYTFASSGSGATFVSAFSRFMQAGAGQACPAGTTCSTLTLTNGPFNFDFAENDLSFYGQDDFRVRDNLVLNLGLRWEWDQQAVNLLHDLSVKNVAAGFWAANVPTSVTEIPKIPEALKNFGPNVGFAYTPHMMEMLTGHDQTVIRGGFRIAYDPAFYNIFSNIASSAPVVNAGTIVNAGLPSDLTGTGVQGAYLGSIPAGQNPGSRNITTVSSNFHNPYVEQWSFGMERQINSRIAFETRYVGNHGVGNFQTINGNPLICSAFTGNTCTAGLMVQAPQYIPSGVTPCTPTAAAAAGNPNAAGRINCSFTNLRIRNNGAWSIYNGLQNELRIRAFHGLTANVSYTWSRAVDNTSEIFASTGGISNPIAENPFDPNVMERGVSAQSFPHIVNTYWVYDIPFMKSQQGLLGRILGGWQLGGTHRSQTGAPITPVQNTNNGDPYCDAGFNNSLISSTLDSCRPLLSNKNAPFDTAGRYLNATQVINVSTCQSTAQVGTSTCPVIDPSTVHFIVNNTFAINALCHGDPFACSQSRNVYRSMPRNQVDLSLAKNVRLTERVHLQLRADLFNALNYQFFGVPGLNVNNKNINGVTTGGAPAPNTFGETWGNTGTNRFMWIQAHITF